MTDIAIRKYMNIIYPSGYQIDEGIASIRPLIPEEIPVLEDSERELSTIIDELNIRFDQDQELFKQPLSKKEHLVLELQLTEKYGFLNIGDHLGFENDHLFYLIRNYIYERESFVARMEAQNDLKKKGYIENDFQADFEKQKKDFLDSMADYSEFKWTTLIQYIGYLRKHKKRVSTAKGIASLLVNDNSLARKDKRAFDHDDYFINIDIDILIRYNINDDLRSIYPHISDKDSRYRLKSDCLLGNILLYLLGDNHKSICRTCRKKINSKRSDTKFCVPNGSCSKIYQKAKLNDALDFEGYVRWDDKNKPIYYKPKF